MAHQLLLAEMAGEKTKWALGTKIYGTIYPAIRLYLIVISGIVAASAGNAFEAPQLKDINPWVPLLAVSVPIVTAVDTWIKPRDKWRGFMKDRDELDTLIIRASAETDAARLEGLNAEFAELRRRHRDQNVY